MESSPLLDINLPNFTYLNGSCLYTCPASNYILVNFIVVLRLTTDIVRAIDGNKFTVGVFLDLSKAFDELIMISCYPN